MIHDSVGLKNLAIIWLYFCIHRYSDEIGEMLWHVVLISDRDLWLPLLWHDSIVGKQMSTFSAGLGSRCPFNCHQTTLPYNCIWFKSNNDTGVNTTVFGRGVSIQRQCWNLLTGSMIRRISKQRHFYHHCNEIIVPWNQCEFLKSQEKYKRQEDVEEEFSNPMLMSWSQKRQIARS